MVMRQLELKTMKQTSLENIQLAEADVGKTMTFTWNGKKPSEGTVCGDTNADTGGTAILCQAFIKF